MRILDARGAFTEPLLTECLDALVSGSVICYPTETFYAMGADPDNEAACERIFSLKGRSAQKQLPLIAADIDIVRQWCETADSRFTLLSGRFWPGPLTLVLPARQSKKDWAIRVSSHPVARQISAALHKPVVSTSANRTGNRPIRSRLSLDPDLAPGIEIFVDAGMCAGGSPSTIVSLVGPETRIIREGAISAGEVLQAL